MTQVQARGAISVALDETILCYKGPRVFNPMQMLGRFSHCNIPSGAAADEVCGGSAQGSTLPSAVKVTEGSRKERRAAQAASKQTSSREPSAFTTMMSIYTTQHALPAQPRSDVGMKQRRCLI